MNSKLRLWLVAAAAGLVLTACDNTPETADTTDAVAVQPAEPIPNTPAKNLELARQFLADNSEEEGVITLPGGLQYKVIKQGAGPSPGPTDKVEVHYHGTLIDGTVFDSSIERGTKATFPVNGLIKGWVEALQLMSEGSRWMLYIPPELAYGTKGAGDLIGPNSALIFDVELFKILPGDAAPASDESADEAAVNLKAGQKFLAENAGQKGVVTLPSGLQYKVITEGSGPRPVPSDKVEVHYHGTLIDGTVFDSSIDRGETITFPVTGVIKGWVEALQLMPVGSRWMLYIPADLAYGERRRSKEIGPNSVLIFDVELIGIVED